MVLQATIAGLVAGAVSTLAMPWVAPVMYRGTTPVSMAVAHVVWGTAFVWRYLAAVR